MRWTLRRLVVASGLLCTQAVAAWALGTADAPAQVESVLSKSDQIVLYLDEEMKERAGEFTGAKIFPTEVLRETNLGAVQIRFNGKDYWADGDKLRIRRQPKAVCLTVSKTVDVAANRNANEGCPGSPVAANAAATPKKKP